MEIRRDLSIQQSIAGDTPFKAKEQTSASINLDDRFSSGSRVEKLPSKPFITETPKVEAEKETSQPRSFANVVSPYIGTSASMALVSGAPGAAAQTINAEALTKTLKALEGKDVKFFEEKSFYIPLIQDKFKSVGSETVAEKLTEGSVEDRKKLRVQTSGATMLPIMDEKDVRELEAFQVTGSVFSLPFNTTSEFLNDSAKSGMELKTPAGANLGAYGAYNYLTTGWEDAGVEKGEVHLVRNGVTIMSLTPEKMNDSFEVQKELKDSWDAYNSLEKLGKKFMTGISETGGNLPFAKKYDIFSRIKGQRYSNEEALTIYGVITKRTDAKESFEDAANYFIDLRDNLKDMSGYQDILQVFNYAKGTLQGKPILEKAFAENIKKTQDINSSIKAMRLMTTPVANESFYDRRDAMQSLVDTVGKDGVEAYEVVNTYRSPDENIKDAASEYADLAKDTDYYKKSQVPRAFEYLRTTLKGQPDMQSHFKTLFKRIKDQFETVQMMNTLKTDFKGSTFDSRVKIMSDLMDTNSVNSAREDFDWLKTQVKPGEKFEDVGNIYIDFRRSAKDSDYPDNYAKEAFRFAREELKGDPAKTTVFRQLFENAKNADRAKKAYETIQQPVGGETFDERKNTALKLVPYEGFAENYKAVCDHIYSGDTMEKVADQLVAVHKTMNNSNYYIKNSREAFIDMKEKSKNDPITFDRYMKLVQEFKNFDTAKSAQELLNKPVKAESYEDREKVLMDMFKWEAGANGANEDALANYKLLAERLDKNETLPEAQSRFKLFFDVLGSREHSQETRDAFTFIADGIDNGTFKDKTAADMTKELVKALLISDNLEDAKEQVLHQINQQNGGEANKTIKQDDEYVIIGGVKLKKKK